MKTAREAQSTPERNAAELLCLGTRRATAAGPGREIPGLRRAIAAVSFGVLALAIPAQPAWPAVAAPNATSSSSSSSSSPPSPPPQQQPAGEQRDSVR
ncbi:MAG: hypothetical protein V2A73_07295, partial [Pseudomonadota bacterium]